MSIVAAIRVEASEGKFLLVSLRRITSYMNFGLDELTVRIFRAACAAPTRCTSGSRVLGNAVPPNGARLPQSKRSRYRDPRSRPCARDHDVVRLQPQRRVIAVSFRRTLASDGAPHSVLTYGTQPSEGYASVFGVRLQVRCRRKTRRSRLKAPRRRTVLRMLCHHKVRCRLKCAGRLVLTQGMRRFEALRSRCSLT